MEKTTMAQAELDIESEKGVVSEHEVATENVDNYSGLDVKTVVVYFTVNLILFAQIANLVGSGAYAQSIAAVLGGADKTTWLAAIFAIIGSCGGPPISQCANYWGRKWFLVVSTAFGCIGCIIISRASSFDMAIGGAVVSGLSYVSLPLTYAVGSEILPRKYRALSQGGMNSTSALAAISGLLIGTTMIKHSPNGFRSFWYMVAALYGVAAVLCLVVYDPPARDLQISLTQKEKLGKLDWVGYALLTSGLVLFNLGLSWSDNPYTWSNAHIVAPFVLGVILLIALAIHQTAFKRDGMFTHRLFSRDRNFVIAVISITFEGTLFYAANSYFFFEASVLFEHDLFKVGLMFSVTFFTGILSAILMGLYVAKYKRFLVVTVLGFLSFMIFNILMATITLEHGKSLWGYPVFLGLGLGACLTSIVTAGQLSPPPDLIAEASGLMISSRYFGGAIALVIYNAVFNSKIKGNLGPKIANAVLPMGLPVSSLQDFITALATNNQKGLLSIPGVTPQIAQAGGHALLEAYLVSFRYVWIIAAVFSAVGAIVAAFLLEPKSLTMHTDAPLVTTGETHSSQLRVEEQRD